MKVRSGNTETVLITTHYQARNALHIQPMVRGTLDVLTPQGPADPGTYKYLSFSEGMETLIRPAE
ncbi:hypothetical protein [Methanothermobacter sp. K4]|uniref:hypothetical protein n=1 Tax=Methanothermobacter sp. K4 TaxID=2913262 RepID=UPI001EDB67C1|nr:hypothetical protein [Methanothermobacter sp. K4]MCG2827879.1 hypothetical protein [Methanothermobacter sp. K4]